MGLASLFRDPCLVHIVISNMLADTEFPATCLVLLHMGTTPK